MHNLKFLAFARPPGGRSYNWMPEKVMNPMAINPVRMNVMPSPRRPGGTLLYFMRSRIDASAMMAHLEYDYRGEVKPPSWIECRIDAVKKGRSSLEHAIEILDLGLNGRGSRLVGVGRSVHVFVDRSTRRPAPWPDELLRKCFSQNEPAS